MLKWKGRICVVLTSVACLAACGGRDEAIRTVRVYDLLQAFPRAILERPGADYVAVRSLTVDDQKMNALYMHPTSSAEFPEVEAGPATVFVASLALEDTVLDKPGDGVEFTVSLKLSDGAVVKLFSRHVNPRTVERDRGWLAIRVPLGSFAGSLVRLVLSTGPGPAGDVQFDWAAWGEPKIFLDGM